MSGAVQERMLCFGASGAIGGAIVASAAARGWGVTAVSRAVPETVPVGVRWVACDPLAAGFDANGLRGEGAYTSVCWAQGANLNDSVYDVDVARHMAIYNANCVYILATLRGLLRGGMLAEGGARMCVVSSIWQEMARQSKLSYGMSKAALRGLVLSAAADMAKDRHLINAVLPGAVDTPMTRKNLSAEQIGRLQVATGFGRLAGLGDVASAVMYLCSPENTGVTGQFVAVDLGYSGGRII